MTNSIRESLAQIEQSGLANIAATFQQINRSIDHNTRQSIRESLRPLREHLRLLLNKRSMYQLLEYLRAVRLEFHAPSTLNDTVMVITLPTNRLPTSRNAHPTAAPPASETSPATTAPPTYRIPENELSQQSVQKAIKVGTAAAGSVIGGLILHYVFGIS